MRARIATLAPEKWLDSRRLKCQIVYLLFDNCENLAHRCRTRGTWAPQTFIAFHSAIVAESGLRPARAESSVHRILNRCFVRVTARHEAYAFFLLTILRSRSRWRPQLAAVCIGESFTCATWRLSVAQCCKLRRRRMRCVWALQPVVNCFAKKCLNVWSLHQFRMPQFCSPAVERALRSRFQNSSEDGVWTSAAVCNPKLVSQFVCHSDTLQITIFGVVSVLEVVIEKGDYATFLTRVKGAFQPRMIGTQTYQSGCDLHSAQAVLCPSLTLVRDSSCKLGSRDLVQFVTVPERWG